ncbi:tripartite tricarboxylate transporter substrate binding protein, partial [Mycobacterium tuberculosis]
MTSATATRGITRRHAISTFSLAALAMAVGHRAHATEAWPAKPVRIIVPFAPGGGADGSARVLAEVLAPQLGQPVIVENKPGAGSAIGVMAALQS